MEYTSLALEKTLAEIIAFTSKAKSDPTFKLAQIRKHIENIANSFFDQAQAEGKLFVIIIWEQLWSEFMATTATLSLSEKELLFFKTGCSWFETKVRTLMGDANYHSPEAEKFILDNIRMVKSSVHLIDRFADIDKLTGKLLQQLQQQLVNPRSAIDMLECVIHIYQSSTTVNNEPLFNQFDDMIDKFQATVSEHLKLVESYSETEAPSTTTTTLSVMSANNAGTALQLSEERLKWSTRVINTALIATFSLLFANKTIKPNVTAESVNRRCQSLIALLQFIHCRYDKLKRQSIDVTLLLIIDFFSTLLSRKYYFDVLPEAYQSTILREVVLPTMSRSTYPALIASNAEELAVKDLRKFHTAEDHQQLLTHLLANIEFLLRTNFPLGAFQLAEKSTQPFLEFEFPYEQSNYYRSNDHRLSCRSKTSQALLDELEQLTTKSYQDIVNGTKEDNSNFRHAFLLKHVVEYLERQVDQVSLHLVTAEFVKEVARQFCTATVDKYRKAAICLFLSVQQPDVVSCVSTMIQTQVLSDLQQLSDVALLPIGYYYGLKNYITHDIKDIRSLVIVLLEHLKRHPEDHTNVIIFLRWIAICDQTTEASWTAEIIREIADMSSKVITLQDNAVMPSSASGEWKKNGEDWFKQYTEDKCRYALILMEKLLMYTNVSVWGQETVELLAKSITATLNRLPTEKRHPSVFYCLTVTLRVLVDKFKKVPRFNDILVNHLTTIMPLLSDVVQDKWEKTTRNAVGMWYNVYQAALLLDVIAKYLPVDILYPHFQQSTKLLTMLVTKFAVQGSKRSMPTTTIAQILPNFIVKICNYSQPSSVTLVKKVGEDEVAPFDFATELRNNIAVVFGHLDISDMRKLSSIHDEKLRTSLLAVALSTISSRIDELLNGELTWNQKSSVINVNETMSDPAQSYLSRIAEIIHLFKLTCGQRDISVIDTVNKAQPEVYKKMLSLPTIGTIIAEHTLALIEAQDLSYYQPKYSVNMGMIDWLEEIAARPQRQIEQLVTFRMTFDELTAENYELQSCAMWELIVVLLVFTWHSLHHSSLLTGTTRYRIRSLLNSIRSYIGKLENKEGMVQLTKWEESSILWNHGTSNLWKNIANALKGCTITQLANMMEFLGDRLNSNRNSTLRSSCDVIVVFDNK